MPIISDTIDDKISCRVTTSPDSTKLKRISIWRIINDPRNVYILAIPSNTIRNKGKCRISPAPEKPYSPNIKNIIATTTPEMIRSNELDTNSSGAPKYRLHDGKNDIIAWKIATKELSIPPNLR